MSKLVKRKSFVESAIEFISSYSPWRVKTYSKVDKPNLAENSMQPSIRRFDALFKNDSNSSMVSEPIKVLQIEDAPDTPEKDVKIPSRKESRTTNSVENEAWLLASSTERPDAVLKGTESIQPMTVSESFTDVADAAKKSPRLAKKDSAKEWTFVHDVKKDLKVGQLIEASWKGRPEFHPGIVIAILSDGFCSIRYADGFEDEKVHPSFIRVRKTDIDTVPATTVSKKKGGKAKTTNNEDIDTVPATTVSKKKGGKAKTTNNEAVHTVPATTVSRKQGGKAKPTNNEAVEMLPATTISKKTGSKAERPNEEAGAMILGGTIPETIRRKTKPTLANVEEANQVLPQKGTTKKIRKNKSKEAPTNAAQKEKLSKTPKDTRKETEEGKTLYQIPGRKRKLEAVSDVLQNSTDSPSSLIPQPKKKKQIFQKKMNKGSTKGRTPSIKQTKLLPVKVKTEPLPRTHRSTATLKKGFYNLQRLEKNAWTGSGSCTSPIILLK